MTTTRKLLATCALPYANGPIHLGHLVEYIQADIWIRYQKLCGHDCIFICGDDTHGTPVMLAARQQGLAPEALIGQIYVEHQRDLQDFQIALDHFYTTHAPENQTLANLIYQRMCEQGDIAVRTISQAYDPKAKMFLPDRYVKGICPCCKMPDQYGDNCEACGSTYTPLALGSPTSVISGSTPIAKESEHYFFKLSRYSDFLNQWIRSGVVPTSVANKLLEWFKEGLCDLDISRDSPYFGFIIPGTQDKYFYVWLDAPIGYIATFKHLCQYRPTLNFADYWLSSDQVELYHFIGKDIINFHAIFWPAILKSGRFRIPTGLFVHGYLTIAGQKMSKSRGHFITARQYLKHLAPDYLRYYFASKLSASAEDIDLTFTDFIYKNNADLVGKLVNIASRCSRFINTYFANQLAHYVPESPLLEHFIKAGQVIGQHFEAREYSQAVRQIMKLTDQANQYIDIAKPWALIKQAGQAQATQAICTLGLNLFRILVIYLKPILPGLADRVEHFLDIPPLDWDHHQQLLLGKTILPYTPLLKRITPELIADLTKSNLVKTDS